MRRMRSSTDSLLILLFSSSTGRGKASGLGRGVGQCSVPTPYLLQGAAQTSQLKLLLHHFLLSLPQQKIAWFMLVEHLPQQRSADLKLTVAFPATSDSLNQQTSNLWHTSDLVQLHQFSDLPVKLPSKLWWRPQRFC